MDGKACPVAARGPFGCLPLLAAVVLSLLLHGALLVALGKRPLVDSGVVGSRPGPALAARLVVPEAPPQPMSLAAKPAETVPDAPRLEPSAPSRPSPEPRRTPSAATVGSVPREPDIPSELPPVANNLPPQDGYLPRKQLTVPPRPAQDIVVPSYIEGVSIPGGRQVGVFTLFIDEEGIVRRAVVDGPTLAPVFQALAERAFLAARFVPGEVDGHPAKALMRVEVVFEKPEPGMPASVLSRQVLPSP